MVYHGFELCLSKDKSGMVLNYHYFSQLHVQQARKKRKKKRMKRMKRRIKKEKGRRKKRRKRNEKKRRTLEATHL